MITSWYAEWKAAFLSEFRREGRWNTSAFLLLLCLPLIYTLLLGAAYSANVLKSWSVTTSKPRFPGY